MKYNKVILNESPLIYTIDSFLDDNQCDYITNISKNKLKRAVVVSEGKGIMTEGRTGLSYWIKHDIDDITKEICERISKLVEISLTNAENMQVIYYNKDQEYRKHFDAFNKHRNK